VKLKDFVVTVFLDNMELLARSGQNRRTLSMDIITLSPQLWPTALVQISASSASACVLRGDDPP
jgi:hypothetical protein